MLLVFSLAALVESCVSHYSLVYAHKKKFVAKIYHLTRELVQFR